MPDPTVPALPEFRGPGAHGSSRAAELREEQLRKADGQRAHSVASDRARFWFAVRIALACVAGCVIGFLPMAWALHTTDIEAAQLAWAVGPVLGQTIILLTLLYGWIRWSRDEW